MEVLASLVLVEAMDPLGGREPAKDREANKFISSSFEVSLVTSLLFLFFKCIIPVYAALSCERKSSDRVKKLPSNTILLSLPLAIRLAIIFILRGGVL